MIGLFNANKVISLQETIISWLPDRFQTYGNLISNFFTTTWFARALPEVTKEHGLNKRIDVKCGFSKQFLKGKLEDHHTSQVRFKDGGIIEWSANFGCGIFIGKPAEGNPMELFQNVIKTLNKIPTQKDNANIGNEGDWKNFRSFFMSANGKVQMDLKAASYFGIESFMQGSLKDLDLNIRDLKVYKGHGTDMKEMFAEEKTYNDRIMNLKDTLVKLPYG
jgi:hypothetical protein